MKASEIEVGKTYVNRGAGTTWRKVLAIGDEYQPKSLSGYTPAGYYGPGVLFVDKRGKQGSQYLSIFAKWCSREKTNAQTQAG